MENQNKNMSNKLYTYELFIKFVDGEFKDKVSGLNRPNIKEFFRIFTDTQEMFDKLIEEYKNNKDVLSVVARYMGEIDYSRYFSPFVLFDKVAKEEDKIKEVLKNEKV